MRAINKRGRCFPAYLFYGDHVIEGRFFLEDELPDVFISYARSDQPIAEKIAAALKAEGLDVWWDGALRAGDAYDEVIEENLRGAGAVVVLWSKESAKSKWVRAEATVGERHSTLVPALIADCEAPIRFELMQTIDLRNWDGDSDDRNWRRLVGDIRAALTDETPAAPTQQEASDSIKTPRDVSPAAERDAPTASIPRPLIAISIFALTMMLGIVMLLIANAIHIGFFTWMPTAGAEQLQTGAKEVGFYYAVNWSIATLLLMPTAWTLIYLALASLRDAWDQMVQGRMVVAKDFAAVPASHKGAVALQKHLKLFVVGGIAIVTALMVMLSMSDHAQVAGQFYGNAGETEKLDRIDGDGYALEAANIERDWMVASFLTTPNTDKVNVTHNNAFGLTAYVIYVGLGIGSLLSFGLVMIGVGAAFLRGVAQNYGLQIIPSLNSTDRRCGFEAMQRFFSYAYAVALIGCVMIYLMGVQNLYLRSPDPTIFAFLSPDFAAFGSAESWGSKLDALAGFLFSENVAKGTRNAYAWIFGFFIFAVFIGGFMYFLRQGAIHGRSVVLAELKNENGTRLTSLMTGDGEALAARLNAMRIWPLKQPSLGASLLIMAALVASFIFYKLGVLIILGLSIGLPVFLNCSRQDKEIAPQ